jgi:hypothetical protein
MKADVNSLAAWKKRVDRAPAKSQLNWIMRNRRRVNKNAQPRVVDYKRALRMKAVHKHKGKVIAGAVIGALATPLVVMGVATAREVHAGKLRDADLVGEFTRQLEELKEKGEEEPWKDLNLGKKKKSEARMKHIKGGVWAGLERLRREVRGSTISQGPKKHLLTRIESEIDKQRGKLSSGNPRIKRVERAFKKAPEVEDYKHITELLDYRSLLLSRFSEFTRSPISLSKQGKPVSQQLLDEMWRVDQKVFDVLVLESMFGPQTKAGLKGVKRRMTKLDELRGGTPRNTEAQVAFKKRVKDELKHLGAKIQAAR